MASIKFLQDIDIDGEMRTSEGSDYTAISTSGGDTIFSNTSSGANNIRIFNGGSERMRIDSTGAVGINKTSPSAKLHIVGGAATGTGRALLIENAGGTDLMKLDDNGTMQYYTDTVIYNGTSNLHLYLKNAGGTNNSLLFWQDSTGGMIGIWGRLMKTVVLMYIIIGLH